MLKEELEYTREGFRLQGWRCEDEDEDGTHDTDGYETRPS